MNLIKKMLVAGSFALAICGCKKNNPSPDNYISYKVDGAYKSSKPDASYLDGSLLIEGKAGADDIVIFFNGYPAPGTYNLANIKVASVSYTLGNDVYDSIVSENGTLVIDSYDEKNISGTFEFKSNNGATMKTITEGKFNAKVEQLGYSTPCSADSTCCVDTSGYGVTTRGKLLKHLKLIRANNEM